MFVAVVLYKYVEMGYSESKVSYTTTRTPPFPLSAVGMRVVSATPAFPLFARPQFDHDCTPTIRLRSFRCLGDGIPRPLDTDISAV